MAFKKQIVQPILTFSVLLILLFPIFYLNDFSVVITSLIGLLYIAVLIFFLIFIMTYCIENVKITPLLIFTTILIGYYTLGLLPISNYRSENLNTNAWVTYILITLCGLYCGKFISSLFLKKAQKQVFVFSVREKIFKLAMFLIIFTSIFINLKFNFPIINPNSRFLVPATLQYIIEFSIPILICYIAVNIKDTGKIKQIISAYLLGIFLLISIGYRNQIIIFTISTLVIYFGSYLNTRLKGNKIFKLSTRIGVSVFLTCCLVLFSILFIIRQENSIELLSWNDFVYRYKVVAYEYVLPIFPIHLSAREAIGVTNIALERREQMTALLEGTPYFFKDLLTLLPGEQLTSGQITGRAVNLSDNTSLTVGIMGGFILSGGIWSLFAGFTIISFLLSYFWGAYVKSKNIQHLIITSLLLSYSLELMNRGIFKPMYILVFILPIIFLKKEVKKYENNSLN